MARKHHQPGPVPPENRPKVGPDPGPAEPAPDEKAAGHPSAGAAFSEQDPKHRLGGYETAGEHAIEQPGGKNAAQKD